MSAFKRKPSAKQAPILPGSKLSPASQTTMITSTGIASLDDILGGGLPLSCTMLTFAPDAHSSYGDLVLKYFISQGLASGHEVCIIGENATDSVQSSMWFPGAKSTANTDAATQNNAEERDAETSQDAKIKIAWRYEKMQQFQTTVSSTDDFCHSFDLAFQIPASILSTALETNTLSIHDLEYSDDQPIGSQVLQIVESALKKASSRRIIRVGVISLGSPAWGDLDNRNKALLHFMFSFRALIRRYPSSCASVSFPPYLSTDSEGWIQKLAWLSDTAISLSAFTGNPALSAGFPSYHGTLAIHRLPSPHTLVSPSDRFSSLRGLSSLGSVGGTGENNLAFKCTRKRLTFETFHLDVEGGIGERRTTLSAASRSGVDDPAAVVYPKPSEHSTVEIAIEPSPIEKVSSAQNDQTSVAKLATRKPKRRVAFQSDRPDLYDF